MLAWHESPPGTVSKRASIQSAKLSKADQLMIGQLSDFSLGMEMGAVCFLLPRKRHGLL